MRSIAVPTVLSLAVLVSGCVIPSEERARLIKEMQDKCAAEGKTFVLGDSKESGIPNITPYEMQISGHCVDKDQSKPAPDKSAV